MSNLLWKKERPPFKSRSLQPPQRWMSPSEAQSHIKARQCAAVNLFYIGFYGSLWARLGLGFIILFFFFFWLKKKIGPWRNCLDVIFCLLGLQEVSGHFPWGNVRCQVWTISLLPFHLLLPLSLPPPSLPSNGLMLHTLTFYLIIHIQMYMYIIQMLTNIIIVHHNIIFFSFWSRPRHWKVPWPGMELVL